MRTPPPCTPSQSYHVSHISCAASSAIAARALLSYPVPLICVFHAVGVCVLLQARCHRHAVSYDCKSLWDFNLDGLSGLQVCTVCAIRRCTVRCRKIVQRLKNTAFGTDESKTPLIGSCKTDFFPDKPQRVGVYTFKFTLASTHARTHTQTEPVPDTDTDIDRQKTDRRQTSTDTNSHMFMRQEGPGTRM